MAMTNEEVFMGSLEKLTGVLTELAGKLDAHIESYSTSDEELAGLNAGKTEEEIRREDEITAQIAVPLVNALDSISAILNGVTEKIMELTAGGCQKRRLDLSGSDICRGRIKMENKEE